MLHLITIACALSTLSGATVLVDARELTEEVQSSINENGQSEAYSLTAAGAFEIPAPADYHVWAWSPANNKSQVSFGEDSAPLATLDIAHEDPDAGQGHLWIHAGPVSLPEGTVRMRLLRQGHYAPNPEAGIASVLLTTNPELKPEQLAADTRVYDQPQGVRDERALTARHTHTIFTFPEYTRATWDKKKGELRQRVLLSSGLWPMPEKTPLNAVVRDEIDKGDYLISRVYFEAYPGFLVTGNLYRPKGEGPFPGVVSPHGHWEKGRLENGERGSVPGRAITLARMGMVTFTYDMIGYNDSMQFPHNWGTEREKLWGIHPFAMQLWSAVRAVDFLETLPYVNKDRIGATGASGGGTQTFALTAVDPRIKVSAPVNMISSSMQGGCLCENAPILRLDNSNMELGAMMAPKPLLMVSASGDWTRETPRVEYPAIRSVYALYGAADRVRNVPIDAPHNYNQPSREAMYRFFARYLQKKQGFSKYTEPAFEVEPDEVLRNFADQEALAQWPTMEVLIEEAIARNQQKNDAQMTRLLQEDRKAYASEYREALRLVLGAEVPEANDLAPQRLSREEREAYVIERWVLARKGAGDAIPALFYHGRDAGPQDAVLLVHGEGKAAFADLENGGPGALIQELLAQGKAVLTIDPFLIGEQHSPFATTTRYTEGAFMDTFQPTDTGYRVQDILTALAWLESRRDINDPPALAGIGDAGVWAVLAAGIYPVAALQADLDGFDANSDTAWVERFYIPCIRAIGGMRAAVGILETEAEGEEHNFTIYGAPEGFTSPDPSPAVTISAEPLRPEALLAALAS